MSPGIAAEMTYAQAQSAGLRQLRAAAVPDPGTDARLLLAQAAGICRDRLALFHREPLSAGIAAKYQAALDRRAAREPLSHITGQREFYGRRFRIGPAVLDPRPDTETLIETALREGFGSVLDLGTGTGCILLTLLAETAGATGTGVDLSAPALDVAKGNAGALKLADRCKFVVSDWFKAVGGQFDLIVSNPPYIAADEIDGLQPEVRDHEPRLALDGGADGLDGYRAITAGAPAHLTPGGRLIVEIGPTQGPAVCALFAGAGMQGIELCSDLNGRDRVVSGRAPAA